MLAAILVVGRQAIIVFLVVEIIFLGLLVGRG